MSINGQASYWAWRNRALGGRFQTECDVQGQTDRSSEKGASTRAWFKDKPVAVLSDLSS